MENLDELWKGVQEKVREVEGKADEWNDASAWLDRHGVPKEMTLEARMAWLFNGKGAA